MITPSYLQNLKQKTFFGWWLVGGAVIIQIIHAGLLMQAYGLYVAVLQVEFGWSKTALATAFSVRQAEGGLLGPLVGWLLDRFGPKTIMRIGLTIFGISFMLFSQVNSLLSFYLVTLLMGLGSSFGGQLALTTTIVNWFEKKRATALATAQIGMSIGGLIIPLVALSLAQFGWRATAFFSGVIILVLGLPVTGLMRSRPEDYGLLPDGRRHKESNTDEGTVLAEKHIGSRDFSARQALKTRAFWFLSLGHGSAVLIVTAVTVHLVVHLNEGLGYSLQAAASVVALMTACTIVGQLVGGFLGDRFNKRALATLAMFGHASALLAVAYATSFVGVLYFAVVHGLSWGIRGPLMSALRADFFGRASFGSIIGLSGLIVMLGSVFGPITAGLLADIFGNYRIGFTILAVMAACGSLFFVFAQTPKVQK